MRRQEFKYVPPAQSIITNRLEIICCVINAIPRLGATEYNNNFLNPKEKEMNKIAIGTLAFGSILSVSAYADSDVGEVQHDHGGLSIYADSDVAEVQPNNVGALDHHTMHDQLSGKSWEFYGMLYASLQSNDAGSALDHNGNSSQTNIWLSTGESTLGFKGSMPLDDDLKAVWQIESTINLDEFGNEAGHAHGAQPAGYNDSKLAGGHNSFLGLSGQWGTVLVGKHNTPFFDATIQFDLFHHLPGDVRAVLGRLPGVGSGTGDHHGGTFNVSASDTIMYKSPMLANGFSFEGAVFALNETLVDNNQPDPSAFGLGARWQQKMFTLVAAYEQHKNFDSYDHDGLSATAPLIIDKTTGLVIGGMLHFNSKETMVGAFFERLEMDAATISTPNMSRNGYYINLQQRFMTKNKVKLAYAKANEFETKDGGQTVAAAIAREIGVGTEVYAVYSKSVNDERATYSNGTIGPLSQGGDPQTVAIGIVHRF